MPKKVDPKVNERCVQQMLEHVAEYPNPIAAAEAVAKRNGVATESVRRWYVQSQIDGGQRRGATSEELAEIKDLKATVDGACELAGVRRLTPEGSMAAGRWAGWSSGPCPTPPLVRWTVP